MRCISLPSSYSHGDDDDDDDNDDDSLMIAIAMIIGIAETSRFRYRACSGTVYTCHPGVVGGLWDLVRRDRSA